MSPPNRPPGSHPGWETPEDRPSLAHGASERELFALRSSLDHLRERVTRLEAHVEIVKEGTGELRAKADESDKHDKSLVEKELERMKEREAAEKLKREAEEAAAKKLREAEEMIARQRRADRRWEIGKSVATLVLGALIPTVGSLLVDCAKRMPPPAQPAGSVRSK